MPLPSQGTATAWQTSVPRTGGSSTLGALTAGASAHHLADCCATTPATGSTHSANSQASDVYNHEADLSQSYGDLSLEEFNVVIDSG